MSLFYLCIHSVYLSSILLIFVHSFLQVQRTASTRANGVSSLLPTFKRYRSEGAPHVLGFQAAKPLGCLCEVCENPRLKMAAINKSGALLHLLSSSTTDVLAETMCSKEKVKQLDDAPFHKLRYILCFAFEKC